MKDEPFQNTIKTDIRELIAGSSSYVASVVVGKSKCPADIKALVLNNLC